MRPMATARPYVLTPSLHEVRIGPYSFHLTAACRQPPDAAPLEWQRGQCVSCQRGTMTANNSDGQSLAAQVVTAARILAANGHEDHVLGHVSTRLPQGDRILMKGGGIGLGELTEEGLLTLDLDGNVLEGTFRLHAEYPIHTEVYRARPDVQAVVHTHPIAATVLSGSGRGPDVLGHEGCWFAPEGIPCFTLTADLIVNAALGSALAQDLGRARGILMRNHGTTTVGSSVAEACIGAIFLEKMCAMQLMAGSLPIHGSPSTEAIAKRMRMYSDRSIEAIWQFHQRALQRSSRRL
ncbi:MAG: class II aldolase/adducin family protein [Dehalococcoidia bacterium]